jgi:hypothetical protein
VETAPRRRRSLCSSHPRITGVTATLLAGAAVLGAGCGSDSAGPGDSTGDLEILTSTHGVRLDPDGYLVTVDGTPPAPIATTGSVTVSGLTVGPLGVELSDLSGNCSVEGENPRIVVIDVGAIARTTFELVCGDLSKGALFFNGATYAWAGDASVLDLTDNWTIEAWVKPADLGFVEQHLVSKWGTGRLGAYALYIRDRRIQVSTRIDPKNTTGASIARLVEGEWQHVAVTVSNGSARILIDGRIDNAFGGLNTPQVTTSPLTLGYAWAFDCCYFHGEMDEVRVWKVQRSLQEIRGAMHRQLLGDEAGLVAYWRLDEGSGDSSVDDSGSGPALRLGSTSGPDPADPAWTAPGRPIEH